VSHVQAVLLLGPEGVLDYVLDDPGLSFEAVAAEYATLLRVAQSALQDSGAGNLVENILISNDSIIIARTVPPDRFLILLSGSHEDVGRARYELRQAALEICNSSV